VVERRTDLFFFGLVCRTLEAAGVLQAPAAGWDIKDFVDTNMATLV
jgi:hypothetical protein